MSFSTPEPIARPVNVAAINSLKALLPSATDEELVDLYETVRVHTERPFALALQGANTLLLQEQNKNRRLTEELAELRAEVKASE